MRHLSLVHGCRVDDLARDPGYWRHPVHQRKGVDPSIAGVDYRSAPFTPLEAHFVTDGEPPYMASMAASVFVAAVAANDRRLTPAVREAFEVLGVFFSTPADDCPPQGLPRPTTLPGGVA